MEALKLRTVDDLLLCPEERVELINGEIVRRPMARFQHGVVQGNARTELSSFTRGSGPGGWWIATEVSVAYETHQCPSHDLAGWRRERLPKPPTGVNEAQASETPKYSAFPAGQDAQPFLVPPRH